MIKGFVQEKQTFSERTFNAGYLLFICADDSHSRDTFWKVFMKANTSLKFINVGIRIRKTAFDLGFAFLPFAIQSTICDSK